VGEFFEKLLDLIFPRICVGCKKYGTWLCDECLNQITPIVQGVCLFCNRQTKGSRFCKKCRKKGYLSGVFCGYYYEPPLSELIKGYKYDSLSVGPLLSAFFIYSLKKVKMPQEFILCPIPLHYKKERSRGFNQALYFSNILADYFNWSMVQLLKRTKETKPQVSLDPRQRIKNVSDAFKVIGDVSSKTIVLVDDVVTTGATINEAARVLKNAGARKVMALTLAKG